MSRTQLQDAQIALQQTTGTIYQRLAQASELDTLNAVNLMKLKFQIDATNAAKRGGMVNAAVDTFQNQSGLDSAFKDYTFTAGAISAPVVGITQCLPTEWEVLSANSVLVNNVLGMALTCDPDSASQRMPVVENALPKPGDDIHQATGYSCSILGLSIDETGTIHTLIRAANKENTLFNVFYRKLVVGDTKWSDPISLTGGDVPWFIGLGGSGTYSAIAVGPNGTIHGVICTKRLSSTYGIDYLRMGPDGTVFPITTVVTNYSSSPYQPNLAVDNLNRAHIVFESYRYNANYRNIEYAVITNGVVSLQYLTTASYTNSGPQIAVDDYNNAHVVWISRRYSSSYDNIDYMRITNGSKGSILTITNYTTNYSVGWMKFVAERNGRCYIFWQSRRYNSSYDNIEFRCVLYNQSLGPITYLTTSTTYANTQPIPFLGPDGSIHVLYTARRLRSGYPQQDHRVLTPDLSNANSSTYSLSTAYCMSSFAGSFAAPDFVRSAGRFFTFLQGSPYFGQFGEYHSSGEVYGKLSSSLERVWTNVTIPFQVTELGGSIAVYYKQEGNWVPVPPGGAINLTSKDLELKFVLSTTNTFYSPRICRFDVTWESPVEVRSRPIDTEIAPNQAIFTALYSGSIEFSLSCDGGTTWTLVPLEEAISLESAQPSAIIRAIMQPGSLLNAWGLSWK